MTIKPEMIETSSGLRSKRYNEYLSKDGVDDFLKLRQLIQNLENSSRQFTAMVNNINDFINNDPKMREHHSTYNSISSTPLSHKDFANIILEKKIEECRKKVLDELDNISKRLKWSFY